MSKAKRRLNKLRSAQIRGTDNFHFQKLSDGRVVFYRGPKLFSWEPLQIDDDTARAFVGKMNSFRGTDIEKIGRPLANDFIRKHRKAAVDRGLIYSGPAEPGNAKGNHVTQNNREFERNETEGSAGE